MINIIKQRGRVAAVVGTFAAAVAIGAPAAEARSVCGPAADQAPTITTTQAAIAATKCVLNEWRTFAHLSQLGTSSSLTDSAHLHTKDMVTNRFFSKVGSDASTYKTRTSAYRTGCARAAVDEVIWYANGAEATPRKMVQSMLNSTADRPKLLNADFRHFGVGMYPVTPWRSAGATLTIDLGYCDPPPN